MNDLRAHGLVPLLLQESCQCQSIELHSCESCHKPPGIATDIQKHDIKQLKMHVEHSVMLLCTDCRAGHPHLK